MSTIIIRPPGAAADEQWQARPDHYCPACGARKVRFLESSGTLYNNSLGLCVGCNTAWEWTYFSEEWVKARTLLIRKALRGGGTWRA